MVFGCLSHKLGENPPRPQFQQGRNANGGFTVPRDRTRARLKMSKRRLSRVSLRVASVERDPRPDFKPRVIFVVTLIAAILIAMAAVWEARVILLVLFAGCLGALVLATLTSQLQSWLRIPRIVAFAAVLAALGLAVTLGATPHTPTIAQQPPQPQVNAPNPPKRRYSSLGKSSWG